MYNWWSTTSDRFIRVSIRVFQDNSTSFFYDVKLHSPGDTLRNGRLVQVQAQQLHQLVEVGCVEGHHVLRDTPAVRLVAAVDRFQYAYDERKGVIITGTNNHSRNVEDS